MSAVRRIDVNERRARLGRRHLLATELLADDPVAVTRAMVALHATDASSVYLSARARLRQPTTTVRALERALYDDKRLVRMLGMRRTMFVVPLELMPIVHAACTQAIAAQERKRTIMLLQEAGVSDDPARWLDEAEAETLAALARSGEALASDLSRQVPRLGQRIQMARGKSYAGWLSLSTRVLFQLSAEGKLVRGRPRGTWTSSQHRWARADTWLPSPAIPAEAPTQQAERPTGQAETSTEQAQVPTGQAQVSREQAQVELVRRWLERFGPAPVADLRWWSGLSAREVQRALAHLQAYEVDLDGTPGVVLPDDLEPVPDTAPWIALLPALDATPMGWSVRDWFLGPHGPALFDRSGNIGPSIWCSGRIVGGWAQRRSGEVVLKLLEDIGRELTQQVEQEAATLSQWLGSIRITPRFRTPLERELSA